jgi:REP element-mobilizing transposase RayT
MPDRWNRYRRPSLRLRDYNYARAGAYFVTICAQDRLCLFGEVVGEDIQLNASGEMVLGWWRELPGKFPFVEADDVVTMPNHVHGIVLVNHQSDIPEPPAEKAALGVIV